MKKITDTVAEGGGELHVYMYPYQFTVKVMSGIMLDVHATSDIEGHQWCLYARTFKTSSSSFFPPFDCFSSHPFHVSTPHLSVAVFYRSFFSFQLAPSSLQTSY